KQRDRDALTYTWEEYDRAVAAALTTAQAAGVAVPLFRSFSPTVSPTRYFPRLSDLVTNTATLTKRLPTVTRPLTFRVTVRDEHNGPQGVVGGLNSSAPVVLSSTSAAGPFLVTAPNTAATWTGNSTQPVSWDVAGTTGNGVNCALVNVRLSTDGGLTYPTLLLANTPNDGAATITVPNVSTSTARIMVEAADNYFFDISDADFAITAAVVCVAPTNLTVSSVAATTASVSFTPSSSATSYVVTTSPATTTQTVTGASATLNGLTPGTAYTVSVASSCGGSTATATAGFTTTFGLEARYQTGDLGQPTDNAVRPFLQLVNTGSAAIPYQQVTVRYWLTVEAFAPLVTAIDWAQLGTSYASSRYVALATPRQGAFGYIEYSFATGAGSLAAGTDSGPIYGKAYKQNWTNFDETDDWSYQTSGSFAPNSHVTVYLNGTLVSGTEPAALPAATALTVYAANQDTSPTTSAINVRLQVGNVGTVPLSYADLRVRYWFTPDGSQPLVYPVDYAVLGAGNFSLQTGRQGSETYAELRFASSLGTLAPSSTTDNIQFRIRKDNWGTLDQTNDYSFTGSATLAAQPRLTAYLNGQLVYGTEPTSAVASRDDQGTLPADNVLTGSPNPFTDQVQLRFTLPRAEAYTLTVYDGQGRRVEELPGGLAGAGQAQEVVWQAGRYAAGLYLVRLHSASTEQQLKFVKQ
ncbi:MAG: T9SS type A sorting domain-containing protein, partial [Cytophagaceae bacterium]